MCTNRRFVDRAGLAAARLAVPHHEHGPHDRGDGEQDAEFVARGEWSNSLKPYPARTAIPRSNHWLNRLQVYFGKTRDIVYDLRSVDDLEKARKQRELQKELVGFIKR